jgi:hypothetical protein
MKYTKDTAKKLNQIKKIVAAISLLQEVQRELLSDYCPESGDCDKFEYAKTCLLDIDSNQ